MLTMHFECNHAEKKISIEKFLELEKFVLDYTKKALTALGIMHWPLYLLVN